MNKILSIIAATTLAASAHAQITITAADMPAASVTGAKPVILMNYLQPSPMAGANRTWRYDSMSRGSIRYYGFNSETNSFFTSAGVTHTTGVTKTMGRLTYPQNWKINYGSTEVKYVGGSKGTFTPFGFSATDTLYGPTADSYLLSAPVYIAQFPIDYNDTWSSLSGRFVNNWSMKTGSTTTPFSHVYRVWRRDSVVGWGKLRVTAVRGTTLVTSIAYDVLMTRSLQYAIDSFYSGSTILASSSPIMTNLSAVQGAMSDSTRNTFFYRKGSFVPLLWLFHSNVDAGYSGLAGAIVDSNTAIDFTSVGEVAAKQTTTVLYPNPATNVVNMMVTGINLADVEYTITDMTGKAVQTGKAELNGTTVRVNINPSLMNGNYILYVADKKNNFETKEEFSISK
jgi:hypothetical protein